MSEKMELEALARKIRGLTLDYAAMHFDGLSRMCNPAYVSEYLRELKGAPIDVSGLIAAQPAAQASAGSIGDDAEYVTLESARAAIEHVESYNGHGRAREAREMLAAATIDSRQRQADQQAPDAVRDAALEDAALDRAAAACDSCGLCVEAILALKSTAPKLAGNGEVE